MKRAVLPALAACTAIFLAANAQGDPYADALETALDITAVEREATPRSYRSTQEMKEVANCELEMTAKTFKPDGELNSVSVTTYPLGYIDAGTVKAQSWPGVQLQPKAGKSFYVFAAMGGGRDGDITFDNILVDDENKEALVNALQVLANSCS